MSILVVPTVVWSYFELTNNKILEEIDIDMNENRNKAELDDVNIENFGQKFENFYNDRVPFRSFALNLYREIDKTIEDPYEKTVEIELLKLKQNAFGVKALLRVVDNKTKSFMGIFFINGSENKVNDDIEGINENNKMMDEAVKKYYALGRNLNTVDYYDDSFFPFKVYSNNVVRGRTNWLFLNDTNIDEFTGVNNLTKNGVKEYVKKYIELNRLLKNKIGKKLLYVVFPEKEEVYPEYMPTVDIVEDEERIIKIRDYLATNSEVNYIYPKEELIEYKKLYRTYYKYDTHWNHMGAFIGNEACKRALNMELATMSELNIKRTKDTVIKNLLPMANIADEGFEDDFDYSIEYKPEVNVDIIVENENFSQYTSSSTNKEKLFYLGDSFRINLIPFMRKDYAKSSFCYIGVEFKDETIKALNEADIIIIEAVGRFEKATMQTMTEILLNYFGG